MGIPREVASRLLSKGVPSAGWYSVLTGSAMLSVAYLLGTVSSDTDAAAPFVAVALAVAGLWQVERGLRAEYQRRPGPTVEPS